MPIEIPKVSAQPTSTDTAAIEPVSGEAKTLQPPSTQTQSHVESPAHTVDFLPSNAPVHDREAVEKINIPGYQIVSTLGRGGMGVVYLARHQRLNRLVALKMVLASHHVGDDTMGRFRAEAEALARLKHPNIIQVYDVGEVDGCPYFSLEYVEGGSLARRFNGTPQSPNRAAELVSVIADAIHAAHLGGVIHRDIKPGNVLLTASGQPKVADFGMAKQIEGQSSQTVNGSILGTPSYMAPEQADGRIRDIGPLADVYALGAILYEALTGRPPFRGATLLETLEQVRTQEPVSPSSLQPTTPRDLETICLKCLQKEPGKRYESAKAFGDDLRRFLNHEPILARSVTGWERMIRWRRRNPAVAALLAFSIAVLVVGLIVTSSLAIVASQRADRIAAINAELTTTTQESEARGELALKTLEAVVKDIQTELANVPNAQKLRGRLLRKAKDGLDQLDDKLRTQKRADRSTALALLSMADVFRQVGNDGELKGPAAANKLYEQAIKMFERLHNESPDPAEIKGQLAEAYLLYGMNLSSSDNTGWEVTAASSAELAKRPLMQRSLTVHRQAKELRRQLLASQPNDPPGKFQLARALVECSYQEVRAGDAETARKSLEEAHAQLKELLADDANHVGYRALFAKCAESLGDWYFDVKENSVTCEPYYRESLDIFKRLAEEQPNDAASQLACANSWSRTADMYRVRKDYKAALAASQQELAITQTLEKLYPDNVQIMMDCNSSYHHNFRDNYAVGNFEAARDMVRKAFDILLPILDADADSHRNISMLARTTKRLGHIHDKLNQLPEAIQAYEAGLTRLTAYVKRTNDRIADKDIVQIQAALDLCRWKVAGE